MLKIAPALIALVFCGFISTTLAADAAGYALVDKMLVLVEAINTAPPNVDQELQQMMAMAKKAKAEQRIDQQFFDRYTRLLRVVKLITMPDREHILAPIADKEFSAFVRDVAGTSNSDQNPAKPSEGPPTIAALAKAITQELGGLKKHLDQQR